MKQQLDKTMPLQLMETYGKILNFDTNGFPADFDTDSILTIRDPDLSSSFEFSMVRIYLKPSDGRHIVTVKFAPQSEVNVGEYTVDVEIDNLNQFFKNWQKIINDSNELMIKYGKRDAILEQSTEEFFSDFHIVDEDAEVHSYPYKVQIRIDQYLSDIVQRLEDYKLREDVRDSTVEELNVVVF